MFSVMIADDEASIRENIPKIIPFEDYGFRVCATAKNGHDALDKIATQRPDVIFLDINMPGMDGVALLKRLRDMGLSHIKVIILSGYSNFEYAKMAMKYGARAYLTKPIDEDEAGELLTEVFGELDASKREETRTRLRERAKALNDLYSYGGHAEGYGGYFLAHCVVLAINPEIGDNNTRAILQKRVSDLLPGYDDCLLRSRGSLFTCLLPRDIGDQKRPGGAAAFGNELISALSASGLECAVILDMDVFDNVSDVFRVIYTDHLYLALSDIFYGAGGCLEYAPNIKNSPLPDIDGDLLEGLRVHLLALDRDAVEDDISRLNQAVCQKRLNLVHIQELSFRIYYLLIDLMSSAGDTEHDKPLLPPPEWRDRTFFTPYDKWSEIQRTQITQTLHFLERVRGMSNMGVCGHVLEYVHRYYKEPIALKQVADRFFINPAYLGRVFQKATGTGFKQYVNELRIEDAKRLLIQTNEFIYNIAEQVGYSESKYFIAKFTDTVGMSPSEYRKARFTA